MEQDAIDSLLEAEIQKARGAFDKALESALKKARKSGTLRDFEKIHQRPSQPRWVQMTTTPHSAFRMSRSFWRVASVLAKIWRS